MPSKCSKYKTSYQSSEKHKQKIQKKDNHHYLPVCNPATNATPNAEVSVSWNRSSLFPVKVEIKPTIKSLLETPPSTL